MRDGIREQVGRGELAASSRRFCAYCQQIRVAALFKVRKGRPPMCGGCIADRKAGVWRNR